MKKFFIGLTVFLISSTLFGTFILSSRGSTSGIGFIFLPIVAIIPTIMAILGYQSKNKYIRTIFFAATLLFFGYEINLIRKVREKNRISDEQARLGYERYANYKKKIFLIKKDNPLNFKNVLIKEESTNQQREFILAILEEEECPSEILLKYSASKDMGFLLALARNKSTPTKILEDIFYKSDYPAYYYTTLASNPNTTTKVLRELYSLKEKNTLIIPNLTRNPSTPVDVLKKINE